MSRNRSNGNSSRESQSTSRERRAEKRQDAREQQVKAVEEYRAQKYSRRVDIYPRNEAQAVYINHLFDESKRIVFAVGPAGTGKSYLGVLRAIKALKDREIERIVIVRPAVGAEGEEHGFLPGTLIQKLGPWLQPLIDIFLEYFPKTVFEKMVYDGVIEFAALMYMRGRTFKDSIIILDEAQNSLPSQMLLLCTRIGENSRAFITGDTDQSDHRRTENGLSDVIHRVKSRGSEMIAVAEFNRNHIERDPIVAEILALYQQ